MVRGHAKAVAQEKNAAKLAEKAKSVKRSGTEVRVEFQKINVQNSHYLITFLSD